MVYEIAKYLPRPVVEAIANQEYIWCAGAPDECRLRYERHERHLLTPQKSCMFGAAIDPSAVNHIPTYDEILDFVFPGMDTSDLYSDPEKFRLLRMLIEFVQAFDGGKITNVREALGLPARRPAWAQVAPPEDPDDEEDEDNEEVRVEERERVHA
jgi:hypothetical protein